MTEYDYEGRHAFMDDPQEWQPGECDLCTGGDENGVTANGPLGPVYCACFIGQGAPADECLCSPDLFGETTEEQPPRANATADHCTGCIVDHDPAECGYRPTASSSAPTPEYGAPWLPLLEGGTGPGVSPDQTRERPDLIPPNLTVVPGALQAIRDMWPPERSTTPEFRPCDDCRTPITCEESGEDRCP